MTTATTFGLTCTAAARLLGMTSSGVCKAIARGAITPCGYVDNGSEAPIAIFEREEVERYRRVSRRSPALREGSA